MYNCSKCEINDIYTLIDPRCVECKLSSRIAKMEEALDKINSRCDEYACGNCAEVKLIVQQALEGEYDN